MASTSSNIFAAIEGDEEMPTSAGTTGGLIDIWGTSEVKDTYRGKLHTVDPFFSSDVPMMGSGIESTQLDQGEGSNLGSNRDLDQGEGSNRDLDQGEGSNRDLDQGEGSNLVSSDVDEEGARGDEGDGDQANTEQDLPGKEKAQDASQVKNKKKKATKKKKSGNTRRH